MPNDKDSSYFQCRGIDEADETSASFLVRLQDRDAEAWKDFMELYVPLIRYWCRRRNMLSRPERQDILQDVLQKVSAAIGKFDHTRKERSFRGWLRRITENRIYDFLQEKGKRADIEELYSDPDQWNVSFTLPETQELDDEIDSKREAEEQLVLLKQVLKRIRPEFREKSWDTFRLSFVAEKDSSEVAETMGMKPDAVRQIRRRILKRIREEFDKLGIEMDLPPTIDPTDS